MAKKPKESDFEKKKEEELKRFIEKVSPELVFPKIGSTKLESREYKVFKEEEKIFGKPSLYERLCKFSEFLKLGPDKEQKKKIQNAIDFAHLKITPKGAFSFAILAGLAAIIFSVLFAVLTGNLTLMIVLLASSLLLMFFLVNYPSYLANAFRINASEEIILSILYMVIYMRSSPNLEGAVRFAAQNLTGPLAYDLRKVFWDVETRKYETIYEALADYSEKWKENREFTEAIHLIRASMEQTESKRHLMLDEAVNTILERTKDKMKNYSQSLRMPVMLIYALGVTLPILVLVMFPILILMMSQTIKPIFLVIGYDVLLPLFIYFITKRILMYRPLGFSSPDITLHPKYSPLGKMKINLGFKSVNMPLWPIGVLISFPLTLLGLILVVPNPEISFTNVTNSLLIVWGIGLGVAVVFILERGMKMKLRNQIRNLQEEFAEALFQLGNRLALGNPLERAMEQTIEKEPDLAISDLFRKAVRNIKKGGLAVEAALFDKKFGAIWEYPSRLVINVMKIIVEGTKKGTMNAALSAISISRYVKQIRNIENDLKEMLSEATSSMRFMAMFLAPMIAGVTVTMATIMMMIFDALGKSLAALQTGNVPGFNIMMIGGWGDLNQVLPIGVFQLVVGVYVIEVCYLLSVLTSGIENGSGDIISRRSLIGWNLLIGLIVYSLSMMITYSMFGPMIENLLTGGTFG